MAGGLFGVDICAAILLAALLLYRCKDDRSSRYAPDTDSEILLIGKPDRCRISEQLDRISGYCYKKAKHF